MTQAGENDHDKELQKAFAEFKESLRHDAHGESAQKLSAPEIVVAEPRRPAAPQPKIDTRPVLGSLEPHIEKSVALAPVTKPASGDGRRKSLLYLSAAIIVTGLSALGWTLTHGARLPEAATTAATPETPPATEAEAAATTETPAPTTQPATAETSTPDAPQTAAAPATAATSAPEQPPAAAAQPTAEKASPTPPKAAAPATTATQTTVKPQPPKPTAKETTAAPAQAETGDPAKPKPVAKPKVVKAKPKPAPAQSAGRPATPAPEPATPAAPVAEASPPPPPPPQSDGALGFVKRTVNSVGSTITNFGRGATGN